MSAKTKLRNALSAIDDAKRRLKRVANDLDDDSDLRRSIRELEDAEGIIEAAIRDVRRLED